MSTMDELARPITAVSRSVGTTMAQVSDNLARFRMPTVPGEHLSGLPTALSEDRLGDLDWFLRNHSAADTEPALDRTARALWGHVLYLRAVLRMRDDRDTPGTPGDGPDTAPRVSGSDTSKAAARAISTAVLRGKREALLRVVLDPANTWRRGVPISAGFTDNELIRYMVDRHFWSPNAPRARRVELWRGGWLEDSGETRDGSTVWVPTAKAFAWWASEREGGADAEQ